jgi:hypothetical protein
MSDPLTTQYQNILQAPIELTNLLTGTGFFSGGILRGFPENIKNMNGDTATIFMDGLDYPTERPMSQRNRPDFLECIIGLISKGTKTDKHDTIRTNAVNILSQFETNQDWITLNDTVRDTQVVGLKITPENSNNTLLTTAIINLKCDVRFRQ